MLFTSEGLSFVRTCVVVVVIDVVAFSFEVSRSVVPTILIRTFFTTARSLEHSNEYFHFRRPQIVLFVFYVFRVCLVPKF